MPKICPRYAQDMHEICTRYAWHMPDICPRYAQGMPKICLRYAQYMPNICPRYVQDMPKICPSLVQDIPKICPRYAHDACTMHIAMIYLDPDAYVGMMHMSGSRMNACIHVWCINLWGWFFVTDQQTNQRWMMHACIYRSVSFVCMMHVSIIFDLWP